MTGRSPLYVRMTSLDYKMRVVAGEVERIRRIINTEQLVEAAKAQQAQRVSKRIILWTDLVRRHGAA